MPELAEVEHMRRQAARWLVGRPVDAVHCLDPRWRDLPWERWTVQPPHTARRVAKWLLLGAREGAWALHFRMTGLLRPGPPSRATRVHWTLATAPGLPDEVCLDDTRRLGELHWWTDAGLEAWEAAHRVPEPWPERLRGDALAQVCRPRAGTIKAALMDASRLGGVGNILACEALWRVGVHPLAPPAALSPEVWQGLADALHALVEETLAELPPDAPLDYVNAGGAAPAFWGAYGLHGTPCRRCGAPIVRTVQQGRGTWSCPACCGIGTPS
jgi:formamidopyrimidine-DNA glycosylase